MGPGLYAIVCDKSGKLYFGESNNVAKKVGSHDEDLTDGVHEYKKLQEECIKFGKENFSFLSLSVDPQ